MNATPTAPLPFFPDLQSGMSYLARLPLANPAVAEQQLIQFLDSLLADSPDASDLFALLEQARVPLCFVEEEMARRYHNKPLALGDVEESAFQRVVMAWRKMGKAYALCAQLEDSHHSDPQHFERIAAIVHRCIYYTGMIILEHYRARRELPAGIRLELHGYYASAEEWRVALSPVDDVLECDSQATHCMAAYVTILLIDMASPYSHSVRDLDLIRRWAGMWAPLVTVQQLRDASQPPPPYVLELMKEGGLRPTKADEKFGADARRLDTSRLGRQINQMLSQLRQRIPPSQLGLGEETSSHVLSLLEQLSKPWAQSSVARKFRRFQSSGTAKVGVGFQAMHYLISGKEFLQPDSAQTYSRSEFDTLFTFRQMVDPAQKLNIRPHPDFPVDEWDVLNHSANGFRLARSSAGQKLAHSQLLALCPHDGERFLLAQVSWLMQEQLGGLLAGVAVLPGLPEGIGVRITGIPHGSEQFVRAFLLPPIPAIDEGGSVVLPSGMYQASHVLEIQADKGSWHIRMKSILQRGMDFERISFEMV